MKLSDGSARGLGALVGVVTFVAAMNVYILAAICLSLNNSTW